MKISVKAKLNHIPHLNDRLDEWNLRLQVGDQLECNAFTSQQEYNSIRKKYPLGTGSIVVPLSYFWHGMMPKIKMTRKLYFFISGGRHRTYSHTEILGRICRAGVLVPARRQYEPFRDDSGFHYAAYSDRVDHLHIRRSCLFRTRRQDRGYAGGGE